MFFTRGPLIVAIAMLPTLANAGSFASAEATVINNGVESKKCVIELEDNTLTVTCKKSGYAKKLSELTDLTWTIASGDGTMQAKEANGNTFSLIVPKKELPALKAALLDNLKSAAAAAPATPAPTK